LPELPEVEIMRRGILHIAGHPIRAVRSLRCRKRPIEIQPKLATLDRKLAGQTVQAVERWGKRLILLFGDESRLVFEPRMTGLVLVSDWPTREHLRVAICFEGLDDLLFWDRRGLGKLTLYSPAEFFERFCQGQLGPDALKITPDQLVENLGKRTVPIKVGLLDQKAVAGVGNIYASEILHSAGVDPRKPCCRLAKRRWLEVHACMLAVLNAAIRYEGSSLNDGTFRNALNRAGRYQNHHRVYSRAGETCLACGRSIRRIVQAQRATYFCPRCQT